MRESVGRWMRRPVIGGPGLCVIVVVAVAVALSGAGASAAATPAIGFSHAVVVDQQRPGFEPDVKIDTNGNVYTSVPFGFSTTESFVWSSRDGGNSYQFTPGTVGPGKPATCVGGGDTDLFLDAQNALYFSDLQGLTNITNSMSTDGGATWNTNCAGAVNTPDDRMWFAGTGSSAAGNLTLYQDYDAVMSSVPSAGNQLVETVSHDGTTFQPVVNTAGLTSTCAGLAVNCVTDNEGISGNQVVDPSTGNVYIAHTTINGNSAGGAVGVQVSEGEITPGTPTTATWTESPNLDASLCPDPTCVDAAGNPEELAGENFASIARDSAGFLYVTFTAGPLDHANSADPDFGALTAPEQIYVVHSLQPAGANPSTLTWSAPTLITGSGASSGTNTFPWVTAGSDGRVDVAWYHTPTTSELGTCQSGSGTCNLFGAGNFKNAEWSVQMGQSLNAHEGTPSYTTTDVSEGFVKHGQICTNGIGCATGGDRSLGDFLQVSPDNQGAAVVSYVFDTSGNSSAGEDAGPEVISRQIAGPSLFASVGTVSPGGGPSRVMAAVTDPAGDSDLSANGTRTPAGDDLDLLGASLANGPNKTIVATIHVKSLASLAASPSVGGPDASWILRWTEITPGVTGNGHIFFAGMDNNQGTGGGGSPGFFDGETGQIPPANAAEHTKFMTFPQTHKLTASQASFDAATGVITLRIPRADVGNPSDGTVLFSGTAFTATSTTPQSATTLFNLTDATTPFELVVGAPGTVGVSPSGPTGSRVPGSGPGSGSGSGSGSGAAGCPNASGSLSSRRIGPLALGMTRRHARRLLSHFSPRNRRFMDFFCLRPIGIRAAYPSRALERKLKRKERRAVNGRIILLLTANSRYALRGVRPGARLSEVARRLRVGRPFKVGLNMWYVTPNGAAHGLLKVRHGRIEEVGVVGRGVTPNRRASRVLLHLLF